MDFTRDFGLPCFFHLNPFLEKGIRAKHPELDSDRHLQMTIARAYLDVLPITLIELETLRLTARLHNGLGNGKIATLGQLVEKTPVELSSLRNVGARIIQALETVLGRHGLCLSVDPSVLTVTGSTEQHYRRLHEKLSRSIRLQLEEGKFRKMIHR